MYTSAPDVRAVNDTMPCFRDIDHQRFNTLLRRHKLSPAIYYNEQVSLDDLPRNVRTVLRRSVERIVRRQLLFSGEMVKISERLLEHDVQPVFLKGPALGLQLFGDVGRRYSVDVDIYVYAHHIPRAGKTLVSLGYHPVKTEEGKNILIKKLFGYAKKDHVYLKSTPSIPVELHYRLLPNSTYYKREIEMLKEQVVNIPLGNQSIPTLKPAFHFLFLCAHGAVHQWFQLFWLRDIAAYMNGNVIQDWNGLLANASRIGLIRPVVIAVQLSNILYGTSIPLEMEGLASQKEQGSLLKACIKAIFNPLNETMGKRIDRMWYLSKLDNSVRYKANTFFGALARYFLEG